MRAINKLRQYTPKIYGVSYSKVASPTLTRTDASIALLTTNIGTASTKAINLFNGAEIYKDIHEITDAVGNVFIRIPKFYIKKTNSTTTYTIQISKQKFPGAYLPWCFWNFTTNSENQYFDIGKYEASVTGTLLESKPSVYPITAISIVTSRTYAQNNGSQYQLIDLHTIDIIQALFVVEFATLHSQSIVQGATSLNYSSGNTATVTESSVNRIIVTNAVAANFIVNQGINIGTSLGGTQIAAKRTITSITVYDASNKAVNFDGAAVNITIGNVVYGIPWICGFSSSISDLSGAYSNSAILNDPFVYRGIENIWGSGNKMIDGINIQSNTQLWVTNDAANYASNLYAFPYVQLSYAGPGASLSTITERGYDSLYPYAQIPTVGGGTNSTYYSDLFAYSAGNTHLMYGGGVNGGTADGIFAISQSTTSTIGAQIYNTRLCKKQK